MSANVSGSTSVAAASRNSEGRAVKLIQAVSAAATDVDNVTAFAKFAKKAEDTAQAAI